MPKSLFLTLVLSLCMVDFSAFAAPRTNARGSTAASVGATQQNTSSVSARAAVQQVQQKQQGVVARSATKKSALSLGTKVATATENTAVSQDCQNAYYGCMDAFCMLDNAAGGRCQCSDRSAELDAVLDEIMRIDEQSARIATEGVEQIQMGEYANQINSVTKSIETELDTSKTSIPSAKYSSSSSLISPTGVLDLSAWSNDGIFDDEVENDDTFSVQPRVNLIDDVAGKTGDNLQKAAARICVTQMPKECQNGSSLLQMAYIQKIRSDCVGYENALKQQRSASQQKLLAAQKAIRDAALNEVRRQNRYETAGECAVAFAQCMQTTAGCKSDYTGCVTLAAAENVRNNRKGSVARQTTIKGVVSGADIKLAASTMESLLAKKEICASVTKQCVNANKDDAVWNVFLRNAAPALKSAELIAEQNLRSNCIPTAAECFRNACKSQFGDNNDNYDMCLSNPATYKSLCKVQLEPCLEATGGSYDEPTKSTLWNGLVAMLNSMKVDACTKEVKDCLLSEDRCGKDYSGCIGLSTQSIGELCPVEKLTACVTGGKYATQIGSDGKVSISEENKQEIYDYVATIAQGLALNIDNAFLTQCQNAANEAMIKVCGDTESCDNIAFDLGTVEALMDVQACKWNDDTGKNLTCLPDLSQFADDDIYSLDYTGNKSIGDVKLKRSDDDKGGYGVYATLRNKPDISNIVFDKNASEFAQEKGTANDATKKVVEILNSTLTRTVGQIEADPKVDYCKTGRQIQGFTSDASFGTGQGRFKNLTDEYKYTIANGLLTELSQKNTELQEKFSDKIEDMGNKITERVMEIAKKRGDSVEEAVDKQNYDTCMAMNVDGNSGGASYTIVQAVYDADTNICTAKTTLGKCRHWVHRTLFRRSRCDNGYEIQEKTDEIKMPKFQ